MKSNAVAAVIALLMLGCPAQVMVTVSPSSVEVRVGETWQFTASSMCDSNAEFVWEVSDPAVANIDGDGLLTGLSAGEVTVTAQGASSGVVGTATAVVLPRVQAQLVVTPDVLVSSTGPLGGPFSPACAEYVLSNPGTVDTAYEVHSAVPWLGLRMTAGAGLSAGLSGTLSPLASVSVEACIVGEAAAGLGVGTHGALLEFRNATEGAVEAERRFQISVIAPPPVIASVVPALGDTLGGIEVTISGAHLLGASVTIGGLPCSDVEVLGDTTLRCRTPALPAGQYDVSATTADGSASLQGAYEAWSPAQIQGARLFDARSGIETAEPKTLYEWQRLTAEIAPDWRVRDGNTLTWLPSTGRFWMVGGWNGYQEPDGFSHVDPALGILPLQNTTNEVWSSADGRAWTLELPHEHLQFERRHVHNTVLWNDALWIIGGDTHQGYYNHDVVSSLDGVNWTVVSGPGAATRPPWAERGMQISGVYNGKLWTMGGQEMVGDPATMRFFNDVWVTEDGVNWAEVAPNAPASETRWARCSGVDGIVKFLGKMWLVGCGCDTSGSNCGPADLLAEVWSSSDGMTWKRHADPPWAGKTWHNVVVWDNKLWILFGYTFGDPANGWPAGNANEVWFSEDGETWEPFPIDYPVPGSHAQGVAVHEDFLLYAGGNYSFGFGAGVDKSAWRLMPFRGHAVTRWTDRGGDALIVAPPDEAARPVLVADAFGVGEPGLQFDGSRSVLALEGLDEQAEGRTVLWVARTPFLPLPWGWDETYAPVGTVLGGLDASGLPNSSIGLSDGKVVMVNREPGAGPSGEALWVRVEGGGGLQEGPGEIHMLGMSHDANGTVTAWVDGAPVPTSGPASFASPRSWNQIGGSMAGNYYGPNSRFAGTIGTVIVLPQALDEVTAQRIHLWASGRYGIPAR